MGAAPAQVGREPAVRQQQVQQETEGSEPMQRRAADESGYGHRLLPGEASCLADTTRQEDDCHGHRAMRPGANGSAAHSASPDRCHLPHPPPR